MRRHRGRTVRPGRRGHRARRAGLARHHRRHDRRLCHIQPGAVRIRQFRARRQTADRARRRSGQQCREHRPGPRPRAGDLRDQVFPQQRQARLSGRARGAGSHVSLFPRRFALEIGRDSDAGPVRRLAHVHSHRSGGTAERGSRRSVRQKRMGVHSAQPGRTGLFNHGRQV